MVLRLRRRALLAYVLSLSSACLFLWVLLFVFSDQTVSPLGSIELTAEDRVQLGQESHHFLKPQGPAPPMTVGDDHGDRDKPTQKEEPDQVASSLDPGPLLIPNNAALRNMTWTALSDLYHRYLNIIQYQCQDIARVGHVTDGGWDVCNDQPYIPKSPCILYSFGVGNDFSFDDDVLNKYQCKVYSFDPSMTMKTQQRKPNAYFYKQGLADSDRTLSNGWDMSRFDTIRASLKHTKIPISIVKMDIEEWEWEVLPDLLASDHISAIRQLLVELHQCEGCSTYNPEQEDKEPSHDHYIHMLELLSGLYAQKFRIYHSHGNKACRYISKFSRQERTACYEVDKLCVNASQKAKEGLFVHRAGRVVNLLMAGGRSKW